MLPPAVEPVALEPVPEVEPPAVEPVPDVEPPAVEPVPDVEPAPVALPVLPAPDDDVPAPPLEPEPLLLSIVPRISTRLFTYCCRFSLPGFSRNVVPLADPEWVSMQSVISEPQFWNVVEELREAGAEGILVVSIDQMII